MTTLSHRHRLRQRQTLIRNVRRYRQNLPVKLAARALAESLRDVPRLRGSALLAFERRNGCVSMGGLVESAIESLAPKDGAR
ncbi:MAG TPA: hypothetical protein VJX91_00155 [Candidatus Eisenbacteria bacterium]|nr:hypothetical protein [Candidatus Eisenbacteria bacterium]